MAEGIEVRHSRRCASRTGGDCNCKPTYQAQVYSTRERKTIKKTFPTLSAARSWRADALGQIRLGTLRTDSKKTLREVGELVITGMEDGLIRKKGGERYKPSVIRSYREDLKKHVYPELGALRLSAIQDVDLQDFADKLELGASRKRNVLMPVRAIYRYALRRKWVTLNPTSGLELPAVEGSRDRFASPAEAEKLVAALPEQDRPLWATAMYAGLRSGELQALTWEDIDLARGVIRVRHSWDRKEGLVTPKSKRGVRTVPIASVLRDYLVAHKLATGGQGFVFGGDKPFNYFTVRDRALRAWEDASLEPIGLHECRHTFASLMIAAGVNAKALSAYMGHSSVTTTYDRYGHLMPGSEDEAAELLDTYLNAQREREDERARQAGTEHEEVDFADEPRDSRATVRDAP
jgi:integrase